MGLNPTMKMLPKRIRLHLHAHPLDFRDFNHLTLFHLDHHEQRHQVRIVVLEAVDIEIHRSLDLSSGMAGLCYR